MSSFASRAALAGLFAGTLAMAGCTPNGVDEQAKKPARSLTEVDVPPNFDFWMKRSVTLSVDASEEVVGGAQASIEVSRLDGVLLYRGPIAPGRATNVKVSVPNKDGALKLRLVNGKRDVTADVTIADGRATQSFRVTVQGGALSRGSPS